MRQLKLWQILLFSALAIALGVMAFVPMVGGGKEELKEKVDSLAQAKRIRMRIYKPDTTRMRQAKKPKVKAPTTLPDLVMGTLKDNYGRPMVNVIVSDGYSCTATDGDGKYTLRPNKKAEYIFYTVPADCEVPTHSDSDRTAMFYKELKPGQMIYDFTLTRLPDGKQTSFNLFVFGDPQITNAINPYYTSPDDNPLSRSDLERFTGETMTDVKSVLSQMGDATPTYGISMGDDVQYYGGYNSKMEMQMRQALGSTRMRVFSVIGNHDQDGVARYRRMWQRSWGPTDYSFDRGDIHFVCFNDVHFYRGASYYSPGDITSEQMEWLRQDLSLTDKSKKVILSYHIPLTFGNSPAPGAEAITLKSEQGHHTSAQLLKLLEMLGQFRGGYELFCGHTHFAINHEITFRGKHLLEHCHAAACGNIWQSNINICGTPNGYYVYTFQGTKIVNCRYKGTFWDFSRQMTLFRADTDFNGEHYTDDWQLEKERGTIVANVFNADSRWRIVAIEDGKEYEMARLSGKGQDAFATGYHHKYIKAMPYRFISKSNGYLIMNHLYYYIPQKQDAKITIQATDPYGNTYISTSDDAIKEPFFNFAHNY